MSKILIIEDEEAIADLEKDYLELSGFKVEIEDRGDTGLTRALKEEFDLIILDLMLPGVDGFEICRQIREEKNIPVIMVSAKKDDIDKIRGLGLGADDYMTKPFSPSELVARVKSHLRRYTSLGDIHTSVSTANVVNGKLCYNKEERVLYTDGEPVRLTATETKIVDLLMCNLGRVFPAEEIYRRVWNEDAYAAENTVMVHIRRIREKIEYNPKEPEYLKVVWGIGYKIEKK